MINRQTFNRKNGKTGIARRVQAAKLMSLWWTRHWYFQRKSVLNMKNEPILSLENREFSIRQASQPRRKFHYETPPWCNWAGGSESSNLPHPFLLENLVSGEWEWHNLCWVFWSNTCRRNVLSSSQRQCWEPCFKSGWYPGDEISLCKALVWIRSNYCEWKYVPSKATILAGLHVNVTVINATSFWSINIMYTGWAKQYHHLAYSIRFTTSTIWCRFASQTKLISEAWNNMVT